MATLKNLFISRGHVRDQSTSDSELSGLTLTAAAIKAAGFVPGDKVYGFLTGGVCNSILTDAGGYRLNVIAGTYVYGTGVDLATTTYAETAQSNQAVPSFMFYEITFTDDGSGDVAESLYVEAARFSAMSSGAVDGFHGIVEADSDVFAAFDEVDHSDLDLQTTYTSGATTGALPANTNGYKIIAQAQGRPNVVARDFKSHVHDGTSVVGAEQIRETENTDERLNSGQMWTVGNGGGTYTVRAAAENNDDVALAYTKILAIDLDYLEEYVSGSHTTQTQAAAQATATIVATDTLDPAATSDVWMMGGYRLKDDPGAGSYRPNWFCRRGVPGGNPNVEFGGSYNWLTSGDASFNGTADDIWVLRARAGEIAHAGNPDENTLQLRSTDSQYTTPSYYDGATYLFTNWLKATPAGGTIHTKVLTDSATISENPEPRRYRDKELSDAETLEDAIKRIYSWRKELSDTIEVDKGEPPRRKVAVTVLDAFWNLTDTAVAQIIEAGSVEVRQLLDSLTPLNDAHIKEFLRFREALDTLGLTDTLRRALNRKMGDAVAVVSDTTSLRRDRLRRIADELDVLDALDPRRSRFKTISETLLVTELPTSRAIYRRLLDVLVTTDNRIAQYIPAEGGTVIGKVLSDTILLPDDLMVQRQFARELLETLELADLANAVTTRQRVLSEATSAVDSALKFLDRRRVLAETAITLSDSAHLGPSDRLRRMLDVFDVFDAFEAYRQRYRVLIESGIGVSDEAIATYLAYTRVRVRPVVGLRRPINFKDR